MSINTRITKTFLLKALFGFSLILISYILSPISTRAAAPTNGLVGYWNFDEGSGSVAGDSSEDEYAKIVT